jgi:hypothetical protein
MNNDLRTENRKNPQHPFDAAAHCIHCYRTLGKAEGPEQRAVLLSAHTCSERLLARRPAAPPPYN